MSLLSYNRLFELYEQGVITCDPLNINGASIDITLGDEILLEAWARYDEPGDRRIRLKNKDNIELEKVQLGVGGYKLEPGEFCLASTREIFNLPNNIAAEYKLKSSLARNGLQHLLAGWCDPGWSNSTLTLELLNVTNHNYLVLEAGMKIGQMVFWECEPVPDGETYDKKGQYNNQKSTQASKGLR